MRSRGPARAAPSTGPSSCQSRLKTSFASEMETTITKSTSLTSNHTTPSETRRDPDVRDDREIESSTSSNRDRSTLCPAPTTQSPTGGVGTSSLTLNSPTSTTSLSRPAWLSSGWRKRSQKEKAATMRRSMDQEEEESISTRDPDFAYRSDEDPELNDTSSDNEFTPQNIFDDWMCH